MGAVVCFDVCGFLFTKYNDLEEVKAGNMAVTTRLILKLFAQGYILSVSIGTSYHLLEAIVVSIISFIILLVLESLTELMLRNFGKLNLDKGTREEKRDTVCLQVRCMWLGR